MALPVQRRLFTVTDYHKMYASGIISEDDQLELIEGEIVQMPPIGSEHASCVSRLNRFFSQAVGPDAIVRIQDPVRLSELSEPEPDVVLAKPRPDFYRNAHPGPEDVLLIVEVADTSGDYDRQVKLPLYARAGIPEVWLVDVKAEVVEVYRGPSPHGFAEQLLVPRGQPVTPLALPGARLDTDALFW